MKKSNYLTRALSWVTVFSLILMCASIRSSASSCHAPAYKGLKAAPSPLELITRLHTGPFVDYRDRLPSVRASQPNAIKTITIPADGTVAISTDYYAFGDTLHITVSSNSGETLLYFYLMNSSYSTVGPKTLPTDDNMFTQTTGSCSLSPTHSDTYTFYINNDGDRSTTIRLSYTIYARTRYVYVLLILFHIS